MNTRRLMLHLLARSPRLYSWILSATGRGIPEKRHYLRLVRRDDTVFDIGANLGVFTVLFSDLVGSRGLVHSFEPLPSTFAQLSDTVRRETRFANIRLNAKACSAEQGIAKITVPGGDHQQASLRTHDAGTWARNTDLESFSVPTIRIDDYVAECTLSRLDFIKCDAEGAELLVLKGSLRTLKRFEPILHLEVAEQWTRDFGYGATDLADLLESVGYTDFAIEEDLIPPGQLRTQLAKRAAANSVNLICATKRHASRLKSL